MKRNLLFCLVILFACQSKTIQPILNKTEDLVIPKRTLDLPTNRYNVAFLIMDGVYNTELTAPYDIFQHTIFRKGIKAMNTFMVANTHNAITSFEGMRILPDFNYLKDELPKIDILVVPSSGWYCLLHYYILPFRGPRRPHPGRCRMSRAYQARNSSEELSDMMFPTILGGIRTSRASRGEDAPLGTYY